MQKRSRQLFESGYYCAESILIAFAEQHVTESRIIPGIATGFCSGMARTCGLCGAVTGGMMAIGLLTGRNAPDIPIEDTYERIQKFLDRFKEKYSTLDCCQLIGCDLKNPEERERFKNERLINTCFDIMEAATGLVYDVIQDQLQN